MIDTIVRYVIFYYPTIKNINYSEDIIKTALVYRFLYEHYVKDYISLESIIYKLDYLPIKSDSSIIRNHLIFHRAFKSFRKHYKRGILPLHPPINLRGCVYLFDCPIKSEVLGYLTGIIYWIFHKGLI